ncbi:hypothetical protein ACIGFK_36975 [Streptomyces sp. NPDC085524]
MTTKPTSAPRSGGCLCRKIRFTVVGEADWLPQVPDTRHRGTAR